MLLSIVANEQNINMRYKKAKSVNVVHYHIKFAVPPPCLKKKTDKLGFI